MRVQTCAQRGLRRSYRFRPIEARFSVAVGQSGVLIVFLSSGYNGIGDGKLITFDQLPNSITSHDLSALH
jgi:hypothetical protein